MTDNRFPPMEPRGKDCLNCGHHLFSKPVGIQCNHPDRPDAPAPVIRWAKGCAQHIPLKNPQ